MTDQTKTAQEALLTHERWDALWADTSENAADKRALIIGSTPLGGAFMSGVYYLIQDSEIVYIGQSICIMTRIATHYAKKNKPFNRYVYINAAPDMLDEMELQEIIKYSPRYNSDLPGNNTYASIGKLKARFREPEHKIRAIIREHNIGHIHALGRNYYFLQEFEGLIKPVKGQS